MQPHTLSHHHSSFLWPHTQQSAARHSYGPVYLAQARISAPSQSHHQSTWPGPLSLWCGHSHPCSPEYYIKIRRGKGWVPHRPWWPLGSSLCPAVPHTCSSDVASPSPPLTFPLTLFFTLSLFTSVRVCMYQGHMWRSEGSSLLLSCGALD